MESRMCISLGRRAKLGTQKGSESFSGQNQLRRRSWPREKLSRDLGTAGEEQGANFLEKRTFPWKNEGIEPCL